VLPRVKSCTNTLSSTFGIIFGGFINGKENEGLVYRKLGD
jgi:hypothetical protein